MGGSKALGNVDRRRRRSRRATEQERERAVITEVEPATQRVLAPRLRGSAPRSRSWPPTWTRSCVVDLDPETRVQPGFVGSRARAGGARRAAGAARAQQGRSRRRRRGRVTSPTTRARATPGSRSAPRPAATLERCASVCRGRRSSVRRALGRREEHAAQRARARTRAGRRRRERQDREGTPHDDRGVAAASRARARSRSTPRASGPSACGASGLAIWSRPYPEFRRCSASAASPTAITSASRAARCATARRDAARSPHGGSSRFSLRDELARETGDEQWRGRASHVSGPMSESRAARVRLSRVLSAGRPR